MPGILPRTKVTHPSSSGTVAHVAALPTIGVIGAGSSGIAAAKALHERGFAFDCFEASDRVGGNWVFKNRNGMSSAYRSLHMNTSRRALGVHGLPDAGELSGLPAPHPDGRVLRRLRRPLRLPRPDHVRDARDARRAPADGTWAVTTDAAGTRRYDALVVANGHHWDPRWPEPAFPGQERFAGTLDALALLHGRGPRAVPRPPRGRARHGQLGDGHRGRVLVLGRRDAISPPAAAPGSCPSTSSGGRSTRCRVSARVPVTVRRRTQQAIAAGHGRRPAALRAAAARPPLRRGSSDGLGQRALAPRARRDHAQAEHRVAERARRALRRRQRGRRRTSSSSAPATRSRSRSSSPG